MSPVQKYIAENQSGSTAISYTYTATDVEEIILISGLNTMNINTDGTILFTPNSSSLNTYPGYATDRIVKLSKGQKVTASTLMMIMVVRLM
jgi:hypothetical protein